MKGRWVVGLIIRITKINGYMVGLYTNFNNISTKYNKTQTSPYLIKSQNKL
jgi:hypothetical protein